MGKPLQHQHKLQFFLCHLKQKTPQQYPTFKCVIFKELCHETHIVNLSV